jgi:hypothetical protein
MAWKKDGAGDAEQRVDDLAARVLGGPAAGLGRGDDSLNLGPLAVGEIRPVTVSGVHARIRPRRSPAF